MIGSSLVDYVKVSPHKTSPRNSKIDTITIHHMAGDLSVEQCGEVFQNREASAHYGIDNDGRVGQYVSEDDRSWSTANGDNDHRAINIELANDSLSPNWHVSDRVIKKCIELCVDICKRNKISKINFTGDKSGNLTMHKWFMATACPGPYLENKFQYIADEINKRLSGYTPTPTPKPTTTKYPISGYMELCQYGDIGKYVKILQSILGIEVDGSFGPATLEAVKNFQRKNNLEIDGSVGPATWQKLYDML